MVGLVILFFLALYLAVSIAVVWGTVRWAKRRGRGPWKWGIGAGLVMYLLVFWDYIPTWLAHEYYCDKYSGITIYATPEEWAAQNPDNVKLPVERQNSKTIYYNDETGEVKEITQKTSRLSEVFEIKNITFLPIQEIRVEVLDIRNDAPLAEYVDFRAGYGNMLVNPRQGSWKFWLQADSCFKNRHRDAGDGIQRYRKELYEH